VRRQAGGDSERPPGSHVGARRARDHPAAGYEKPQHEEARQEGVNHRAGIVRLARSGTKGSPSA
jgi:hypothetical protein